MVARTGCLIERSLRNTSGLARHDFHAVGDLNTLFRNEQVSRAQSADDLDGRIAFPSDTNSAFNSLAVVDDIHDGVFRGPVVAIYGGRRHNNRLPLYAGLDLALCEHAGLQLPWRGDRNPDLRGARFRIDGRAGLDNPSFKRFAGEGSDAETDALPGAQRSEIACGH